MDYLTPIGRAGSGEAPNDAACSVAEFVNDLLLRAGSHDAHVSMLLGSLLSASTLAELSSFGCDVLGLLRFHLRRSPNRGTIRALIWCSIAGDGSIPLDEGFLELLNAHPSRFEIRISNTDANADEISHFILASPVNGDEDCVSSVGGVDLHRLMSDCKWGLRIERPHGPEERRNFAAWNSFCFEPGGRSSEYLAVRDGPRLLGLFNSVWKKATVIEPDVIASVTHP